MRRALELAQRFRPHPNPRVGAVVVDGGQIVGEGAHRRAGDPHAEPLALQGAGSRAEGATMFVTLEPCAHHGRTPPCVAAIIEAGIDRVVVGAEDPDVRVSGKGVEALRQAGVTVEVGFLAGEIEAADPGYFHHRRTGRARVVHKTASTLDGQIAAVDGTSQWITGEEARRDVHELRASVDAVLIGAGTLLTDDPLLDVRLPDFSGPQPRPVIVAGSRPLPATSRIWERDPVVIAPGPLPVPGELVVAGSGGRVDLEAGLTSLADLGLFDILVEGGAGISGSLWDGGLIDAGIWYLGAMIAGGIGRGVFDHPFATLADGRRIEITRLVRLGPDLRIDWIPST